MDCKIDNGVAVDVTDIESANAGSLNPGVNSFADNITGLDSSDVPVEA